MLQLKILCVLVGMHACSDVTFRQVKLIYLFMLWADQLFKKEKTEKTLVQAGLRSSSSFLCALKIGFAFFSREDYAVANNRSWWGGSTPSLTKLSMKTGATAQRSPCQRNTVETGCHCKESGNHSCTGSKEGKSMYWIQIYSMYRM